MPAMTREEAIAEMEAYLTRDGATVGVAAQSIANWIAALREQPEKELPDSEGWWWEWTKAGWRSCQPGRWVRCSPPPSQPPGPSLPDTPTDEELAATPSPPPQSWYDEDWSRSSASPQADGGPGLSDYDRGGRDAILNAIGQLKAMLPSYEEPAAELTTAENERLTQEIAHFRQWQQTNACKHCGNVPDDAGLLDHRTDCYVVSEDGGGSTSVGPYAAAQVLSTQPLQKKS